MLPFIILISILSLASTAHSHLLMGLPSTWGLSHSLENPLDQRTPNFMCGGRQRPANGPVTTIQAGQVFQVPVICGEAIHDVGNAASICGSDRNAYHGGQNQNGGGGCALSIAYTSTPRLEDFIVFSVNHECPKVDTTYIPFNVPSNLPAGEATLAWTWIPPTSDANSEMYFNCATVRVQGPAGQLTGGRRLANHIYGVPGYSTQRPSPIYRNTLPSGALPLSVGGGGSGGNNGGSGGGGSGSGPGGDNNGGGGHQQCQSGHSRCGADPTRNWEQCSNGVWYTQQVPWGTRCVQNGNEVGWRWWWRWW